MPNRNHLALTTSMMVVFALAGGCKKDSSEKLPPGHGPGAMGSKALIDPILDKDCGEQILARDGGRDKRPRLDEPFQADGIIYVNALGLPETKSNKNTMYRTWCTDAVTWTNVSIVYQRLGEDVPAHDREPIYEMKVDQRVVFVAGLKPPLLSLSEMLQVLLKYSAPILTRAERQAIEEVDLAQIESATPRGGDPPCQLSKRMQLSLSSTPSAHYSGSDPPMQKWTISLKRTLRNHGKPEKC